MTKFFTALVLLTLSLSAKTQNDSNSTSSYWVFGTDASVGKVFYDDLQDSKYRFFERTHLREFNLFIARDAFGELRFGSKRLKFRYKIIGSIDLFTFRYDVDLSRMSRQRALTDSDVPYFEDGTGTLLYKYETNRIESMWYPSIGLELAPYTTQYWNCYWGSKIGLSRYFSSDYYHEEVWGYAPDEHGAYQQIVISTAGEAIDNNLNFNSTRIQEYLMIEYRKNKWILGGKIGLQYSWYYYLLRGRSYEYQSSFWDDWDLNYLISNGGEWSWFAGFRLARII